MSETKITCYPTKDTFLRFGIVLVAFFGFGLYFFYDGAIGYRHQNAVYFSHQAFVEAGKELHNNKYISDASWHARYQDGFFPVEIKDGAPCVSKQVEKDGEHTLTYFPISKNYAEQGLKDAPAELLNRTEMAKSWSDAWQAFSEKNRFPIKPIEKPHDEATIREQWLAGSVCMLLSSLIIYLIIRTARRRLILEGNTVHAIGKSFQVSEITRIDLRQWGPGQKGVAYFTINGKKIRIDGMTYGGFDKKNGEPAELFMKTLLAIYQGEIIEYADEKAAEPKD